MSQTVELQASFRKVVEPDMLSQKQHRELTAEGFSPIPVSEGVAMGAKAKLLNVEDKQIYVTPRTSCKFV